MARLGPDPLRADADPERAWRRISASHRPIGDLLMDQEVIAGVGNVYRAEVLFRHRLHPLRPGPDAAPRPVPGDVGRPGRADDRGGRAPAGSTPSAPSTCPRRWAARRARTTTAARSTSTVGPASRATCAAQGTHRGARGRETCSGARDASRGSDRGPTLLVQGPDMRPLHLCAPLPRPAPAAARRARMRRADDAAARRTGWCSWSP